VVFMEQGEIFERELLAWLNRRNLAP